MDVQKTRMEPGGIVPQAAARWGDRGLLDSFAIS